MPKIPLPEFDEPSRINEWMGRKVQDLGIFSTLKGLIDNSPQNIRNSQEWLQYLKPGQIAYRVDPIGQAAGMKPVEFPLTKRELMDVKNTQTGQTLRDWLGSLPPTQKVSREDVADFYRLHAPNIDPYYASHQAARNETPEQKVAARLGSPTQQQRIMARQPQYSEYSHAERGASPDQARSPFGNRLYEIRGSMIDPNQYQRFGAHFNDLMNSWSRLNQVPMEAFDPRTVGNDPANYQGALMTMMDEIQADAPQKAAERQLIPALGTPQNLARMNELLGQLNTKYGGSNIDKAYKVPVADLEDLAKFVAKKQAVGPVRPEELKEFKNYRNKPEIEDIPNYQQLLEIHQDPLFKEFKQLDNQMRPYRGWAPPDVNERLQDIRTRLQTPTAYMDPDMRLRVGQDPALRAELERLQNAIPDRPQKDIEGYGMHEMRRAFNRALNTGSKGLGLATGADQYNFYGERFDEKQARGTSHAYNRVYPSFLKSIAAQYGFNPPGPGKIYLHAQPDTSKWPLYSMQEMENETGAGTEHNLQNFGQWLQGKSNYEKQSMLRSLFRDMYDNFTNPERDTLSLNRWTTDPQGFQREVPDNRHDRFHNALSEINDADDEQREMVWRAEANQRTGMLSADQRNAIQASPEWATQQDRINQGMQKAMAEMQPMFGVYTAKYAGAPEDTGLRAKDVPSTLQMTDDALRERAKRVGVSSYRVGGGVDHLNHAMRHLGYNTDYLVSRESEREQRGMAEGGTIEEPTGGSDIGDQPTMQEIVQVTGARPEMGPGAKPARPGPAFQGKMPLDEPHKALLRKLQEYMYAEASEEEQKPTYKAESGYAQRPGMQEGGSIWPGTPAEGDPEHIPSAPDYETIDRTSNLSRLKDWAQKWAGTPNPENEAEWAREGRIFPKEEVPGETFARAVTTGAKQFYGLDPQGQIRFGGSLIHPGEGATLPLGIEHLMGMPYQLAQMGDMLNNLRRGLQWAGETEEKYPKQVGQLIRHPLTRESWEGVKDIPTPGWSSFFTSLPDLQWSRRAGERADLLGGKIDRSVGLPEARGLAQTAAEEIPGAVTLGPWLRAPEEVAGLANWLATAGIKDWPKLSVEWGGVNTAQKLGLERLQDLMKSGVSRLGRQQQPELKTPEDVNAWEWQQRGVRPGGAYEEHFPQGWTEPGIAGKEGFAYTPEQLDRLSGRMPGTLKKFGAVTPKQKQEAQEEEEEVPVTAEEERLFKGTYGAYGRPGMQAGGQPQQQQGQQAPPSSPTEDELLNDMLQRRILTRQQAPPQPMPQMQMPSLMQEGGSVKGKLIQNLIDTFTERYHDLQRSRNVLQEAMEAGKPLPTMPAPPSMDIQSEIQARPSNNPFWKVVQANRPRNIPPGEETLPAPTAAQQAISHILQQQGVPLGKTGGTGLDALQPESNYLMLPPLGQTTPQHVNQLADALRYHGVDPEDLILRLQGGQKPPFKAGEEPPTTEEQWRTVAEPPTEHQKGGPISQSDEDRRFWADVYRRSKILQHPTIEGKPGIRPIPSPPESLEDIDYQTTKERMENLRNYMRSSSALGRSAMGALGSRITDRDMEEFHRQVPQSVEDKIARDELGELGSPDDINPSAQEESEAIREPETHAPAFDPMSQEWKNYMREQMEKLNTARKAYGVAPYDYKMPEDEPSDGGPAGMQKGGSIESLIQRLSDLATRAGIKDLPGGRTISSALEANRPEYLQSLADYSAAPVARPGGGGGFAPREYRPGWDYSITPADVRRLVASVDPSTITYRTQGVLPYRPMRVDEETYRGFAQDPGYTYQRIGPRAAREPYASGSIRPYLPGPAARGRHSFTPDFEAALKGSETTNPLEESYLHTMKPGTYNYMIPNPYAGKSEFMLPPFSDINVLSYSPSQAPGDPHMFDLEQTGKWSEAAAVERLKRLSQFLDYPKSDIEVMEPAIGKVRRPTTEEEESGYQGGGKVTRRGFLGKLGAIAGVAGAAAAGLPKLLEKVKPEEIPKVPELPPEGVTSGFATPRSYLEPKPIPEYMAHHLDQVKEHLFTRPNASWAEAQGIPERAPFSDFDDAIAHLETIHPDQHYWEGQLPPESGPAVNKAIQRIKDLKQFHIDLNTPGGMDKYGVTSAEDFTPEQFWREHAASHAIDELSTIHGIDRIPHPEEMRDFNPSETTILNDFAGPDAEKRLARLQAPERKWRYDPEQKQAIVDGLQSQINFRKAVEEYLQAHPQQTEAGLIADWYSHPNLMPGGPADETAFGKLLNQHSTAGPDPEYLGDSLFEHLEKYP